MTPGEETGPKGLDAGGGVLAPQDYVVRGRDDEGGSLPRSAAYHDGIPRAVPFVDTWYFRSFDEMAERNPVLAAEFARFHDDVLNAAVETAAGTSAEEWDLLRAENQAAREAAEPVDAELGAAREALAALDEAEREAMEPLATAASEAAAQAAEAVGAAGGELRPDRMDEDPLPRPRERSLPAVAADFGMPWPPVPERALMSPLLYWPLAALSGAGMGLSFGAMAGMIHLDALANDSPAAIGFAAALGFSMTAMAGAGVHLASRWASSGCFAGWKKSSWVPAAIVAASFGAAIVAVFAVVDQQGLMKLAALDDAAASLGGEPAGPSGPPPWAMLVGSLALALPSVFLQACTGAWKGRGEIENRVRARQEREKAEAEAAFLARPETRAALAALAHARLRRHELDSGQARFAKDREAIGARITRLEAARPQVRHRLSEESRRRIQDALDQAQGLYARQQAMVREMAGGGTIEHRPKVRQAGRIGWWAKTKSFLRRKLKGGS